MNTATLNPIGTTTPQGQDASCRNTLEATPPLIHLKSILVPLDFSPQSLKSLQYAIPVAKHFGAKLTLLYVVEPLAGMPELPCGAPNPPDPVVEIERELMRLCVKMIPPELLVETVVVNNFVADGVIEVARVICADLIITTTHNQTGLSRLLMDSTVDKVMRHAPCPVLVLSEREPDFV